MVKTDPITNINFSVPYEAHVKLTILNISGQVVATLLNETKQAGSYNIDFDASTLTSGIYFYTIVSGNFIETHKMILLK
jgi:flagellar hook assembly protein FlgD